MEWREGDWEYDLLDADARGSKGSMINVGVGMPSFTSSDFTVTLNDEGTENGEVGEGVCLDRGYGEYE